jgi:hypothetical protein
LKRYFIYCSICAFFLFSCQPTTQQDRAAVGPEATVAPAEVPPASNAGQSTSPSPEPQPADGLSLTNDWEARQKSMCDEGQPSGCSALAYDALRAQQIEEAVGLFTRACLVDESQANCSARGFESKGLARACVELSALLQQQGKSEDAKRMRTCACNRGFKSACAPL